MMNVSDSNKHPEGEMTSQERAERDFNQHQTLLHIWDQVARYLVEHPRKVDVPGHNIAQVDAHGKLRKSTRSEDDFFGKYMNVLNLVWLLFSIQVGIIVAIICIGRSYTKLILRDQVG